MWKTEVQNYSNRNVVANGRAIAKDQTYKFDYTGSGIGIQVAGLGLINLVEPDSDFRKYVTTTWGVKISSGNYVGYWGYEGEPVMTIKINPDGTFSTAGGFENIPIGFSRS